MMLAGLVAWVLLARGRRLTRPEGLLLLGVYASTLPLLR
jgi:Ca2+/Na+ antiporter